MKKIFLLVTLSIVFSGFAFASSSPVVQVISYKEPLGMYYSLQGWGSGSIIDSNGHILTNNHVVDDGVGGISDDFSVCLTDDPALPPKCDYTASVVSRDAAKDIALLQIDPKDIFGNAVDFSRFTTLTPDFNYRPAAGDAVMAQGYPWVGANTITRTQGIVSGTYSYNDNTYIKTDTLIAGGNSGGPLIRDGKMIGVNTFLIGGSSDPALGYSLAISEARDFIERGLILSDTLQTNSSGFAPFLQQTNTATQTKTVTDSLVTFRFPVKYNVTTYIPGSYIDGQISEESTTAVYGFSFMHFNIPALSTPEEIRYFLSGQSFFPFWDDVKFKTITIGGQSFYEVDTLGNASGDKTKTQYVYFKIINKTHLILLQLATPFSNETTYDDIQKNISAFLAGVRFPATFTFPGEKNIAIKAAGISVTPPEGSLVDYRANFFPYDGIVSQFMTSYNDLFTVRTYRNNLWSYAQLSVVPNSFYTENTSAAELLARLKESPSFAQRTESRLVKYRGKEGFITCENSNYLTATDEKNATHPATFCEVVLLVGDNDSHFLSLMLYTDRRDRAKMADLIIQYLNNSVDVGSVGETDFGTTGADLRYADVADQSPEFRETLRYMVRYGILADRPIFDGEHPFTWAEYSRFYIWAVYHKNLTDRINPTDPKSPTFATILKKIPYDSNAYVNSSLRENFELMLRMRLAGVTLPVFSESTLNQFKTQAATTYREEWQKIEDFEYLYFAGKKMTPTGSSYFDSGYYTSDFSTYYSDINGLSHEEIISTDPLYFGKDQSRLTETLKQELECSYSVTKYFSPACVANRREYVYSLVSYPVLTKGDAVSALVSSIDFALWDKDLAAQKLVKIEDEDQ